MKKKLFNNVVKTFRVIDGDTIECMIDMGFNTLTTITVQFDNYIAPSPRKGTKDERNLGLVHKVGTSRFLTKAQEAGKTITVETVKKGSFGRWIGTFFVDNVSVTKNRSLMKEINITAKEMTTKKVLSAKKPVAKKPVAKKPVAKKVLPTTPDFTSKGLIINGKKKGKK